MVLNVAHRQMLIAVFYFVDAKSRTLPGVFANIPLSCMTAIAEASCSHTSLKSASDIGIAVREVVVLAVSTY